MTYTITKVINNSSKSVLLTNPKSERDTYLLAKNSSRVPSPLAEIQHITEKNIPYEMAIKRALNIYTASDNWCFWDNGRDTLVGCGEKDEDEIIFLAHSATNLHLIINENGVPSFAAV